MTQSSPAQTAWQRLGYGMFIHFGPNTLAGTAWGDGKFPVEKTDFPGVDCAQWAEVAAEAGMRYAVLTTKHHDGFHLWPTRHSEACTRNTPSKIDLVGRFVEAFRAAGIAVGLYYSLWDVREPCYNDDAAYNAHMRNQLTELLTDYGPILELWFDGAWDKDFPTKTWPYEEAWEKDPSSGLLHGERWEWQALYDHIKRLQPDCLVVNNSSSDRPGVVRYMPVDLRTAEHPDFVWRGRVCRPPIGPVLETDMGRRFLPLEYCTSLNPGWFFSDKEAYAHPSGATIAEWLTRARGQDANLLLNIGPDTTGRIPEYHRSYLRDARQIAEWG